MKPNMHPFSSKRPEPHSPSNVSGTLGTTGSSCSGRSSRGHAYVPRHGRIYAASLFLGQKIHLGLCALLGMAIICLTYLFAGEGAWMFVVTEQAVELGFTPDPSYLVANTGIPHAEALTCSALAGTVLLPFVSLAMCWRTSGALHGNGARTVSLARGGSAWWLALGDLLAISLPVQALFAITVLGIAGAQCFMAGHAELLGTVVAALVPRLLIILMVHESFIVCGLAAFRLIRNRVVAFGIMSVVTVASCIAQLSFPEVILPIHAGLWMHASSITAVPALALPATVFSVITGVTAFAPYVRLQR